LLGDEVLHVGDLLGDIAVRVSHVVVADYACGLQLIGFGLKLGFHLDTP